MGPGNDGVLNINQPGYLSVRNISLDDGVPLCPAFRTNYRNNSIWDIREGQDLNMMAPDLWNLEHTNHAERTFVTNKQTYRRKMCRIKRR